MTQTETITWTAVGDGLPPRCNWYLVTTRFGVVGMYWMTADGHFEFDDCTPVRSGYIIAWANMPRGYRTEGAEHGVQ